MKVTYHLIEAPWSRWEESLKRTFAELNTAAHGFLLGTEANIQEAHISTVSQYTLWKLLQDQKLRTIWGKNGAIDGPGDRFAV